MQRIQWIQWIHLHYMNLQWIFLGIVAPLMDIFGAVDYEVLMSYLEEKERRQRDVKLDGTLLTEFMFKRHY